MATNPPITSKAIEEDENNSYPNSTREFDNIISTLPLKIFGPRRLRRYRNFWLPEFALPGTLLMEQTFKSRPTDIFLATYPKSGTTWLKALMFATMNRTDYPLDQHPLTSSNPHELVTYMEIGYSVNKGSKIESIPPPRLLHTHLPCSILPNSITSSNSPCKIIYVCRDPKDVLVSSWHFIHKSPKVVEMAPFSEGFELFCEGISPFGPIWGHVHGYWYESMTKPDKVLFLKYEEMLKEPVKNVKRLASFMGCPFSEEEEKQGVVEQVIGLCSFDNLKNLKVNNIGQLPTGTRNDAFFRKGKVGDWRNHMTQEMAKRLDGILEEKFKESSLMIPSPSTETIAGYVEDST